MNIAKDTERYDLIDGHHHLWNPISAAPDVGYVWLRARGALKPFGDPTPIQRDYLLDEFLAEHSPRTLKASVHVQADGAIADPVAETAFIQALSDKQGFPLAIIGFVDLTSANAVCTIERHMAYRSFRGVRQILSRLDAKPDISFAPVDYIRQPVWCRQFALLGTHKLVFDLQCYPEQMADIAAFLADYPDIPVVVDHMGSPWDQSLEGQMRWYEGMKKLAQLDQVSVKVSGLGMFDRHWTADSVRPMFEKLTALFGPSRLLFGSNFPVDSLMKSYNEIIVIMQNLVQNWPSHEQRAFFSENARLIYQL